MLAAEPMSGHDVVQAGDQLTSRYRLVEEIGRGGIGAVWRARDLTRDRDVAVKVITPLDHAGEHSNNKVGRFIREARAMSKLKSPHIVRIFDNGSCPAPDGDGELAFIAMELLVGEPLRDRVKRGGGLSPEDTMRVMSHVGRAVGLAHQRGIVHRDLKPANIFLCSHPDGGFVGKVLDFGMVKSVAAPLGTVDVQTETGRPLGTPYYMSPEQARGLESVDHRTDLWAMGVIAFECLTGERPFQGRSLAKVFSAIAAGDIPAPSSLAAVPVGFDAWFAHAVQRDKQQRFQSAKVMVDELQEVLLDASTLSTQAQTLVGTTLSDVLATTMAPPGYGERTLVATPMASDTSFVGREAEMKLMDEAVGSHCRVLLLRGARGVGRSRLAREWAASRREQFSGGVWLCSLAGVEEPSSLWQRIGLTLNARVGDRDPVLRLSRALTGLGRVLVIVERVDGVRDEVVIALNRLLRAAPHAIFLLTGANALDVPTERVIDVRPLRFPEFGVHATTAELSEYPAVELFMKRGFAFDRSIVGDRNQADTLGGVVRRTNGNALAIESIAARLDTVKLAEMPQSLDASLMPPGGTTLIDADSIVKGCVRWALDRLEPHLQATMVQCGAFRGSFTAQAAEAVVDLGAWPEAPPVADALALLVARGLVRKGPEGGETRFGMHPIVFETCWLWLREERGLARGDRTATLARHARFFAQLGSEEAMDALRRRGGWVRRSRYLIDLENASAAAERALEVRDGALAAACSLAAATGEELLGRYATAAARLVTPASVEETPPEARVRCLVAQGMALIEDGRLDAARQLMMSAGEQALAVGQPALHATALRALGELHLAEGRPSYGYATAERARQLCEGHGDRLGAADAMLLVANAQRQTGAHAGALATLDAAKRAYRELGARRREAETLEQIGDVHGELLQLAQASGAAESALAIQAELGDRWAEAHLLGVMGERQLLAGLVGEATSLLEQASGRGREQGACELEGRFMAALASAYAAGGKIDRAMDAIASGEQVLRQDRPNGSLELAMLLCRRTHIELLRGARDQAVRTLQEIEALVHRLGGATVAIGRELGALRLALR